MKSTGTVRKVDHLGRIVFPTELRRTLNIKEKDMLEIFVDGDKLVLKKYTATGACVITGDVLDSNVEYAPGLFLSPTGVKELLKKLTTNH